VSRNFRSNDIGRPDPFGYVVNRFLVEIPSHDPWDPSRLVDIALGETKKGVIEVGSVSVADVVGVYVHHVQLSGSRPWNHNSEIPVGGDFGRLGD